MPDPNRPFDAAIVGLGAAGCQAAKALTERGLRVVAIDAGRLLAAGDRPERARPVAHWRRVLQFRRQVQARSVSFHPRLAHLYVDDRQNPYGTAGGDRFLWIRGRQVGGRLHTWARMSLRLGERDFTRASDDGHGRPWPIRYADLAPYYDAIETFHGLRGADDGIANLPDGVVSEPRELSPCAARFRDAIRARWPERAVIAPRVLAHCTGAVPTPLEAALGTGALELVTDAPVARIVLDGDGTRARGVECVRADGTRSLIEAGLVFLCASSIESVRILLNSRCAHHPDGLGNRHDVLGRYLLDHNFVVAAGPVGDGYRGLEAARDAAELDLADKLDFYVPDFSDTLASRDFVRGFGVQGTITDVDWGMGSFGEMLPHPDNRVTLARRRDAFGIPVPNIAIRRHPNDRAMIAAQKREVQAMAEAADLRIEMPVPRLFRRLLWKWVGPEVGVMHLGLAIHECGGARMGDDPRRSVVDPDNRLWDVPNVLVTDGACIPNTGCQNPTLTIMALTARACALAASR